MMMKTPPKICDHCARKIIQNDAYDAHGFCQPEIASQMKVILGCNYALVEKAGKTFNLQLGYCAFRVTSCFVIAAILRTE